MQPFQPAYCWMALCSFLLPCQLLLKFLDLHLKGLHVSLESCNTANIHGSSHHRTCYGCKVSWHIGILEMLGDQQEPCNIKANIDHVQCCWPEELVLQRDQCNHVDHGLHAVEVLHAEWCGELATE